jgi:hypothetical protein
MMTEWPDLPHIRILGTILYVSYQKQPDILLGTNLKEVKYLRTL